MTENELKNLLAAVTPPDEAARAAAHAHWAALAKPLGGLGRLEGMVEDAAALTAAPASAVWPLRPTATLCPSIWALRAHPCPARRIAALLRARLTLPPALP